MNIIHIIAVENRRLLTTLRVQPLVATTEPQHLLDPIGMMQFQKQRADHVVKSWTKPAASYNGRASFGRIKKKLRSRTS
ncbi:hypothetical protein SDC9_169227 [bioreactor metagenome]|uniref:Uncharacterized protein n=1 Tax=bioreactor metagenome TaxID=1076179 RepID=A0A645G5C2_9ZZZZ